MVILSLLKDAYGTTIGELAKERSIKFVGMVEEGYYSTHYKTRHIEILHPWDGGVCPD